MLGNTESGIGGIRGRARRWIVVSRRLRKQIRTGRVECCQVVGLYEVNREPGQLVPVCKPEHKLEALSREGEMHMSVDI